MMDMVSQTVGRNQRFAEGANPVDWYYGGRIWNGNVPPAGRTQINPWGVIFRTDGQPPPANINVEVGDLSLYILYAGVWQRVTYSPRVIGEMYPATFEGYDTGTTPIIPANYYTLPNAFIVTDNDIPDWCYHFYLPRIAITGTIQGIVVTYKARLVRDGGGDASPGAGKMLAWVGCDYKMGDGTGIQDSFVSAMMPLGTKFQRYYGTTLTLAQLQENPPPIVLEQL